MAYGKGRLTGVQTGKSIRPDIFGGDDYPANKPCRIDLVERIIADIGVPVQPVLIPDGVGLETDPPTRPRRNSGDFPLCHLALRRLTRARFARSPDLALEAVLAAHIFTELEERAILAFYRSHSQKPRHDIRSTTKHLQYRSQFQILDSHLSVKEFLKKETRQH
jgi:hypothetical protein